MRKTISVLVALILLTASPSAAQQPTLVVENGRVITGAGTVLEDAGVADEDHTAVDPGAVTITEMKMLRWGGMFQQAIIQAATAEAARALGKVEVVVQDGNVVHAR